MLDWSQRLLSGLTAAAALGVLILAACLRPDPSGVGTHTTIPWMHLGPCGWLSETGVPCPTCGMTTSFAWFSRGDLVASAYVQPMGLLLAVLTAMVFWVAIYVVVSGRPAYRLLRLVPGRYYGVPLLALFLAAWGWKIYIHLRGIDGWR